MRVQKKKPSKQSYAATTGAFSSKSRGDAHRYALRHESFLTAREITLTCDEVFG